MTKAEVPDFTLDEWLCTFPLRVLERSLIVERVQAGLRNARAKGKRLGRPRVFVDAARIARLRTQGRSILEIADELGYCRSLVHKTLANGDSRGVAIAASLVSGSRESVSKTDALWAGVAIAAKGGPELALRVAGTLAP
jgi:hypothetical protein